MDPGVRRDDDVRSRAAEGHRLGAEGRARGAAALVAAMLLDLAFPLPLPNPRDDGAVVVAADGTPLRAFADRGGIWRYPVTPEQVSPLYLQALLNYEDRWFWKHPGINPVATAARGRAMAAQRAGGVRRFDPDHAGRAHPRPGDPIGYAHALRPRSGSCCARCNWKCICPSARSSRCTWIVRRSAARSKAWKRRAGRTWASRLARLSHAEAALLAVLPQSPSRLRPDREPERARIARDKVLARMATLGVWSRAQVADARIEPVVARSLQPPRHAPLLAQRLRFEQPHVGARAVDARPGAAAHAGGSRRRLLLRPCPRALRPRCWWSTTPRWRRAPTSARWHSPMRRGWATSTWSRPGVRRVRR